MTKVLIAEDSPTQAVGIQALLEEASYDVTVAVNGVAALEKLPEVAPDIVLTDMEMPEMNGLELVNAILLQHPSIPVVLMTALGNDELAVEALERGASAYIPKSMLNEMLLETVEQVVGLMRAERSYSQLIECLDYNEFRFTLTSDSSLIDPLVDLMQQVSVRDPIGRVRLGMALEHALTNALFHGNLEFSREELESESESLVLGQKGIVAQRLEAEPYSSRRIHFSAKITDEQARFVIRDDGPGFDTSTVPGPGDAHQLEREGGRGLMLMRSFMDEVTFNDRGNEVTLTKRRAVEVP